MKHLYSILIEKLQHRKRLEFSKLIVGFLILNASVWIYLSYALAYLGREEIAETLSKTIAAEIVGVFALYATKSLFENLSKNNTWPDKPGQSVKNNTDKDC